MDVKSNLIYSLGKKKNKLPDYMTKNISEDLIRLENLVKI